MLFLQAKWSILASETNIIIWFSVVCKILSYSFLQANCKLFASETIIRDKKGVWLSNKVFWWAKGIFELAVRLAIYFGGNALIAAVRWSRSTIDECPTNYAGLLGFLGYIRLNLG